MADGTTIRHRVVVRSVAAARWLTLMALASGLFASCGSSGNTSGDAGLSTAALRNELFRKGHHLYLVHSYDSADVVLRKALNIDSSSVDVLTDLGMLHYDMAMEDNEGAAQARNRNLRESSGYLSRLDALGTSDESVYERLCQISVTLGDDRGFLKYAKRSAERFPFERQYYNLGLAYFGVADYQNVVRTQKEAIDRFKQSAYLGGYYRQLGRAYMKIDRDQTAQRSLEAGLSAVDDRLAALKATHGATGDAVKRLTEDRTAILQLLRRLYQVYHFDDKLKSVERRLSEAGALP